MATAPVYMNSRTNHFTMFASLQVLIFLLAAEERKRGEMMAADKVNKSFESTDRGVLN